MINRNDKNICIKEGNLTPMARTLLNDVERELRNPISTIIAASDMLAEQLGPDHPGIGFAWLIRNESDRLHRTLRDLDLLALPLPFAPRNADLRPAVAEIAARFQEVAKAGGIEFACRISDEPLRAVSNAEALSTVLDRLLAISIESLPQGGRVTLEADRARNDVVVRLIDYSTRPASRGHSADYESQQGWHSGLGVAACKRIVEHLGGVFATANGPEGGLCIELRFTEIQ